MGKENHTAREKTRTQNAVLNISFSLASQFVTVLVGLVLPQLMIKTYGSETNGLISSITQFLSFITLMEAGAGGVIRSALYPKLAKHDMEGVSGIYNATKLFFKRIGLVFIFYVLIICLLFPFISKTQFDFWYVVLLILILSFSTGLEYFLGLTNYSVIVADQKAYVIHISNIAAIIINFVVAYMLILFNVQIHIVKLVSCMIFAIKPLFYALYVKKNYNLDKNSKLNNEAIAQRWNGLVHHLAYFIHTNVDVVILTIFMGTGYVSIYMVYAAIIGGIKSVIMSVTEGIAPGIGNLIAQEDNENVVRVFERVEFIQTILVTILLSTTATMLIPFIQVYTIDITDYNYVLPLFGLLIVLAESFYCVRCVYTNFSLAAGKYKETQLGAVFEAGLNLLFSLMLITKLGMVGIAVGTVIGMLIRMIFDMRYTSKHILNRPIKKSVENIVVQFSTGILCVFISKLVLPQTFNNWLVWVLWACIVFCGTALIVMCTNMLVFRKKTISLIIEIKDRLNQKIK